MGYRMNSQRRIAALCGLLFLLAGPGALAQSREWIARVRTMAWAKDVAGAQRLVEAERPAAGAVTSAWLAGVSWLARGASFAGQWDVAERYAAEAYEGSRILLKQSSLDQDSHLETALGASIEVLAGAYNAAGDRARAVEFLRGQRALYRGTAVELRIQKNYLLYSLEGKPMPPVKAAQYLHGRARDGDALRGKVTLFFFWAHWCGDCKRQKPVLEALYQRYGPRGFTVVGPTRFFGYISRGRDATPAQELTYLRGEYQEQHPVPAWMDVPISDQVYSDFGVSTTPTLVLVDREGIVRLYHPGTLNYEELADRIEKLLG